MLPEREKAPVEIVSPITKRIAWFLIVLI